jgi:CO dehydrogenase maturation factor
MKPLIAVSGKGGTGKTTLSALLVRSLVASGVRPVLAVDADPNYCLAEFLGAEMPGTLADLRDRTRATEGPTGSTKVAGLELGLNELVSEGKGYDLITMGRPEGAGCYCYINALLRGWLEKARRNYAVTVVDNEAGMEHVSRLVTASIDTFIVVAEPTVASARAVGRIFQLADSLPMHVGRRVVVWNKVIEGVPERLREMAAESDVDASVTIPYSDKLMEAHADGSLALDAGELPSQVAQLAEICVQQGAHSKTGTS